MEHSKEQMALWAKEKEEKNQKRLKEFAKNEIYQNQKKEKNKELIKKVGEIGASKDFTEQEKNTVKLYLEHNDLKGAHAEGNFHTISALERHFKKNKIPLEKITKSNKGLSKSIYPNINGKIVRISDHELPETEQRLHNKNQGLTGKWNKEVIIDDWKNKNIKDYLKEIYANEEPTIDVKTTYDSNQSDKAPMATKPGQSNLKDLI